MMNNLFTQIYIRMAIGFIATTLLILALLTVLVDRRYESFVEKSAIPAGNLVSSGWLAASGDEQTAWLDLVSSLTNTTWQLNEMSLNSPIEIIHSSWIQQSAEVNIRLTNQLAVCVKVSNWRDWYIGIGWLILNDISLQPSDKRQAYFEQLQLEMPWQLERVDREEESLSKLSLRQLKSGQAVFLPAQDQQSDWLYLPGGAEQVIKIGPIARFETFSILQWFGVLTLALSILAIALTLITRPIYNRIEDIRRGLADFTENKGYLSLPTDYSDNLGLMAKHIEDLSNDLIKQAEQNKQLNMAVSHDLKTPIARLKFALEMAKENQSFDQLETMDRDIQLLTNLINELLLYHQLNSTKHSELEPFDIAHSLYKQVRETVPSNFELKLQVSHTKMMVPIDPSHWRRLSQNLIDNAMQYGQKRLSIHLKAHKHCIEFKVNDDGPGLTPRDFESFLMPFQRKDQSRGTLNLNHGLGLSLVQAVTAHYDGQLSLEPSALGGCCISVTLPLWPKTQTGLTIENSSSPLFNEKRVLL
ncbi:hypothetical protein KO489_08130 [Reinekea forsetii]|nr:hypothetical protein [Reinekea forsetii]